MEIANLDAYLRGGRFNILGIESGEYDDLTTDGIPVLGAADLNAFYLNMRNHVIMNEGREEQRLPPFSPVTVLRKVESETRRGEEYYVLFFPDEELGVAIEVLEGSDIMYNVPFEERLLDYEKGDITTTNIKRVGVVPVGAHPSEYYDGNVDPYQLLQNTLERSLDTNSVESRKMPAGLLVPSEYRRDFLVRKKKVRGRKPWPVAVNNVLELYADIRTTLEGFTDLSSDHAAESNLPLSAGVRPYGQVIPAGWEMVQFPGGSVVIQLYGPVPKLEVGERQEPDPNRLIPLPQLAKDNFGNDGNGEIIAGIAVNVFDTMGGVAEELERIVKRARVS